MSLNKRFLKRFVPLVAIILISHIFLSFLEVLGLKTQSNLILDAFLFLIFALGAIIIGPGLDKEPGNFVNRFLILTTLQLLSAMSVLAVLVFMKTPDVRRAALQFIAVFVILLAIQSFFLVKGVKKPLVKR
ncbi:MAG: hypothetical protein QNK85_03310 [Crocinitomicaceae bacterium]|jgi:hypothetical protein